MTLIALAGNESSANNFDDEKKFNASLSNSKEDTDEYRRLRFYIANPVFNKFYEYWKSAVPDFHGRVVVSQVASIIPIWRITAIEGLRHKRGVSRLNFVKGDDRYGIIYASGWSALKRYKDLSGYFGSVKAQAWIDDDSHIMYVKADLNAAGCAHLGERKQSSPTRRGGSRKKVNGLGKIETIITSCSTFPLTIEEMHAILLAGWPNDEGMMTTVKIQLGSSKKPGRIAQKQADKFEVRVMRPPGKKKPERFFIIPRSAQQLPVQQLDLTNLEEEEDLPVEEQQVAVPQIGSWETVTLPDGTIISRKR